VPERNQFIIEPTHLLMKAGISLCEHDVPATVIAGERADTGH
jgi:hypothetical protein